MKTSLAPLLLALCVSATAAPVDLRLADDGWRIFEYGLIPSNTIRNDGDALVIAVNASNSPLLKGLPGETPVQRVRVTGSIDALPTLPDGKNNGDEGADDFPFRLGLVLAGDQTLTGIKHALAPAWVKQVFELAPEGTGIDSIRFLNLSGPRAPDWQRRIHPASRGLFEELIVGHIGSAGDFSLDWQSDTPLPVVALWLSIDGDSSGSTYTVTIDSIDLD